MLASMRPPALLAAIAAAMFFANLGGAHLWDVDEAIFAQAAKEMLHRGDYVTPYFNGQVFPDKPAMMYWLMIGAYKLFGTTEFAARSASAIFGIGSVLLTYRLGRLMFSPAVGFWSGLVLASSLNFCVIARAATPDAFLTFFSTLAMLAFVSGTAKARARSSEPNERNAPWCGQTRFEPSWAAYALAYAAMGCAVLTKGPIGVILPTAVIGLFLLIMRAEPANPLGGSGWRGVVRNVVAWSARVFSPLHFFRTVWSMRPITAMVAVLAVAGPWYTLVGIETDGQWLVGFFGVHNFGRFLNAMESHSGPIFYYVIAVAIGFFPWSVLLAPGFLHMKRLLNQGDPWRPGYVLVCSWAAVWVGFFSVAGTKLPSYVVPAYPALALLTGSLIAHWMREPCLLSRVWTRLAFGTLAMVGVGMIVALPIVAHVYLADDFILGAIGLVPLIAAVLGWVYSERERVRGAVGTLSVLAVALPIALFGFGAAYVDRYQDSPPLARRIADATSPGHEPAIGSFRYFRPSFVFYTDRQVQKLDSADAVHSFFAAHARDSFVLTTDTQLVKLRPNLPSDVGVLASCPRFLRAGNVVLLGRSSPDASTAAKPPGPPSSAVH
jgi:4-amino-4-deoxy-L-arabinose transferase-like glycosyltransferase